MEGRPVGPANYEWALRRPGRAPFIMLTEFPRSGGNWIRDMLGDALQLPVLRFSRLPATFPSIVHNHDYRVLGGHRSVYVLRDGRDVLSHMDKTITTFLDASPPLQASILRLHPLLSVLKAGGVQYRIDPIAFYGEWRRRSLGSRVSWGEHVGPWRQARPVNTTFVRYEDMQRAPEETLAESAVKLRGGPVSDTTITFAVARNSFEAQTGRKPGEKDVKSTKRMGLSGVWKTQMSDQLQKIFLRAFGKTLSAAGYET